MHSSCYQKLPALKGRARSFAVLKAHQTLPFSVSLKHNSEPIYVKKEACLLLIPIRIAVISCSTGAPL